ncbi:MAG: peptidoglycan DL-endopeptidase CwlO [Actinomycetota bacterium]|jgi:hypothetical protein|nr:peptidoglycan DL-endopeptidase CwlO [Actinomycetota bacterium]
MRTTVLQRLVRALFVVGFVAGATTISAVPASAANVVLGSGQTLYAGSSMNTGTGCMLIVQSGDGNVVEYCNGTAVFDTHTQPHPGDLLTVQTDGNVVVYAGGTWLWQTGTHQYNGAILQLQDDQNLVVYATNGAPLWAKSWLRDATGARQYAQNFFIHYGWSTGTQYPCLNSLWIRESNWQWNATNPSSGAYGIPQALPASKLATAGTDWHDSGLTQVQWGENYIAGRYGNPCAAWSHEQTYGWY